MKRFFPFILFFFLFHTGFSQIKDSLVIIREYFTVEQAKKRKYQSRDSIIANTKTDNRFFRAEKEKYFINNKEVSKSNFFVEQQKQTDEKFRPFKRLEYYRSGKIHLKGNFFHGDGLLDSCRIYYENGIVESFSTVELDTLPAIIRDGIKWPYFIKKKFTEKLYNRNGILQSYSYGKQNEWTEEEYNTFGKLKRKTIKKIP